MAAGAEADSEEQIETRVDSIDVKLAKVNAELQTYQQKMSKMRDGPGKNAIKQRALKVLQQRKMLERSVLSDQARVGEKY